MSDGRPGASENGGAIGEMDGDCGVGEGGGTPMVAEDANGDEGTRGKSGEDVCLAGREWETWNGELSSVGGCDGAAIGEQDSDAGGSGYEIGVWCFNGEVVASAAGVKHHGGWRSGRGPG